MTADSGTDDPDGSVTPAVAGETTRVAAVQYLEGASGHGVFSLLLVLVGTVLFAQGLAGVAAVTVIGAYGVPANGLTVYLWDELRSGFVARLAAADGTATRTLTPIASRQR